MSRNSTGTFSLAPGNPVTGGKILKDWANQTFSDIANELTDSLSRSGKGSMTAQLKLIDGTAAIPAFGFGSETGTGFYRAAAGKASISVTGTRVMDFQPTAITFAVKPVWDTAPDANDVLTNKAYVDGKFAAPLTLNGAGALLYKLVGDNAYIGGYAADGSTQRGFTQFTTNSIRLGGVSAVTFAVNNVDEVTVSSTSMYPVTNLGQDLGLASNRWATVYASSLNLSSNASISGTLQVTGAATLSSNLSVGGTLNVTGASTLAGLTVGAITGSGNVAITGNITASGAISGATVTQTSDIKLKKDIVELKGKLSGFNPETDLHLYRYRWKHSGDEDIGLIAQEIQQLFPTVVVPLPDGTLTIDYAKLAVILFIDHLRREHSK